MAATFHLNGAPVSVELTLDGASILDLAAAMAVEISADSVHNAIEIRSVSPALFALAGAASTGAERLELRLGEGEDLRVLRFLLEERRGSEGDFSLWGRTKSARLDEPFAEETSVALVEPRAASAVAAELTGDIPLSWRVVDWDLPAGWSAAGRPLDLLQQIASAVGAIARAEDDGSLVVRRRFPVRPYLMPQAAPTLAYGRDDLAALTPSLERGDGCDCALVQARAAESVAPLSTEILESDPLQGEDVHVRVWWPGGTAPEGLVATATDGTAELVSTGVSGEEVETVSVQAGRASLPKPAADVLAAKWLGTPPGGVLAFEASANELRVVDLSEAVMDVEAVARVKYATRFDLWRVRGAAAKTVLLVFSTEGGAGLAALVKHAPDSAAQADSIASELLTDLASCVEAGTAALDAARYDRQRVGFEAPYRAACREGALAVVSSPQDGVEGVYLLIRAGISIEGPVLKNDAEALRCLP